MTSWSRTLMLVGALAATGCGAAEGDLFGDVFVVTKGGENVKLGLVEVRAISEDAMRAFLSTQKHRADSARGAVQAEYERAKRVLDSTNAVLDGFRASNSNFDSWVAEYSIGSTDAATFAESATRAAWATGLEGYRAASRRMDVIRPTYERWSTIEYYLDGLPPAEQSAKTDADGRFVLHLKRGKRYALVARAQREVGEKTEVYDWVVWTSLGSNPGGRVMLSNDSMLSPDDLESKLFATAR